MPAPPSRWILRTGAAVIRLVRGEESQDAHRVLRAGAVRARRAGAAARGRPRDRGRLRSASFRAARPARGGGGEARAPPAPPEDAAPAGRRAPRARGRAQSTRRGAERARVRDDHPAAGDRGGAAPRLALLPSLAAPEVPRRQRARLADPAR